MKNISAILTVLCLFSNNVFCLDNIENLQPISSQTYFIDVFDMINSLQSRLTLANKKHPSEILGREEIDGYISGKLIYEAKLHGVGVDVTITYDNFCDEDGWIFDGTVISHAKVVGKGNYEGEVTVKGIMPGKIIYRDVKSKLGYPTEGTFEVMLDGFNSEIVDLQNAMSAM